MLSIPHHTKHQSVIFRGCMQNAEKLGVEKSTKVDELQTTKTSIYPDEELLERIKSYAATFQMSVNKLAVLLLSKGVDSLDKNGVGYLFDKKL